MEVPDLPSQVERTVLCPFISGSRFVLCISSFLRKTPPLYSQFCLALTKEACCWHSINENTFINNLVVIQLLFAAGMDSLRWSFSTLSFYLNIFMSISLICSFKVLFMPFRTTTTKAHTESLEWKLWPWQPLVHFCKTPRSLEWGYHIYLQGHIIISYIFAVRKTLMDILCFRNIEDTLKSTFEIYIHTQSICRCLINRLSKNKQTKINHLRQLLLFCTSRRKRWDGKKKGNNIFCGFLC